MFGYVTRLKFDLLGNILNLGPPKATNLSVRIVSGFVSLHKASVSSQARSGRTDAFPVEGGFWKTEVGHDLVARMTAFVPVLVEGTPGLVASICSHFLTEIINYSSYPQSFHSILLL